MILALALIIAALVAAVLFDLEFHPSKARQGRLRASRIRSRR